LLATWIAICLAEPAQLHTCAMHGGLAISPAAGGGAHGHSAAVEQFTTHSGAAHSHQDQNSDSQSRQCSCIGDCNAGSSPIGLAAAGISLATAAISETSAIEVAYDSPHVVAPDFFLPFSNGPPTGSSRA
jgi:hypothetical protein